MKCRQTYRPQYTTGVQIYSVQTKVCKQGYDIKIYGHINMWCQLYQTIAHSILLCQIKALLRGIVNISQSYDKTLMPGYVGMYSEKSQYELTKVSTIMEYIDKSVSY